MLIISRAMSGKRICFRTLLLLHIPQPFFSFRQIQFNNNVAGKAYLKTICTSLSAGINSVSITDYLLTECEVCTEKYLPEAFVRTERRRREVCEEKNPRANAFPYRVNKRGE